MKTVAVIGAGISGLSVAYLLSRRHRVHLFERERRLGGHTNTVLIATADGSLALDFGELGVATRDSDMSFAVSCRQTGLEYSSRGANGFFAQRGNLVSWSHLSLLREILRFNREAPALLRAPDAEHQTLGHFLDSRRFGEAFTRRYLFPMASAIWSASLDVNPQRIRLGISACLLGERVRFDGGHKRDPFLVKSLGRFVDWVPVCPEVECGLDAPREFQARYSSDFMQALTTIATPRRQANVLQHMLGYFKQALDPESRSELLALIEEYAGERVPLVVPLTLFGHHIRRCGVSYLAGQVYLQPHPVELMLRNHV